MYKYFHKKQQTQQGFTLIEMIVSLGIFAIVITVSVGALLMLIATNNQLQSKQNVMTNLSFALDSMTREIRTGSRYFCDSQANYDSGADKIFKDGINAGGNATNIDEVLGDSVQDCPAGRTNKIHGLAFIEGGDSITGSAASRILYFYDENEKMIYRRVGAGPAQSIISSGIEINQAEFYVTGSAPLNDDPTETDQAMVTIYIEAVEKGVSNPKPYRIQTTVTQRALDI